VLLLLLLLLLWQVLKAIRSCSSEQLVDAA
jgi:hypothetical protein